MNDLLKIKSPIVLEILIKNTFAINIYFVTVTPNSEKELYKFKDWI